MNASNIDADRLLTEHEASDRLGVSPSTLNSWRVRRVGPAFVRVGRLVRYRAAALTAWITAQEVGTSDQPKGAAQ